MRENERQEQPGGGNSLYELIDRLENTLLQARSVPFTTNCMVDKEEMLILIGMLRDNLPVEIKQANWLLDQNRQVVAEARKDAENITRQAEKRVAAMIDEHEITMQARQLAAQTIEAANKTALQIRHGALDYATKRLTELEDQLTTMLVTLQKNKKELR
ncbi:MAG: ATPase [Bacillota bacterium]|nr:ATPase [Bacillota bacterium]